MGNKVEKTSHIDVEDNVLHFFDTKNKFQDLRIPLTRPLDVQLVPQFATTDTPGKTVRYKLQLRFKDNRSKGDINNDDLEISTSSSSSDTSDENTGPFRVTVELIEIVTREGKKSTIGISRKASIVKCNSWVGKASDFVVEAKRIRLKGVLKQIKNDDKLCTSLDFDLILCPSKLIIPECGDEWALIGTFYANNMSEKKDYKWRAAVTKEDGNSKS